MAKSAQPTAVGRRSTLAPVVPVFSAISEWSRTANRPADLACVATKLCGAMSRIVRMLASSAFRMCSVMYSLRYGIIYAFVCVFGYTESHVVRAPEINTVRPFAGCFVCLRTFCFAPKAIFIIYLRTAPNRLAFVCVLRARRLGSSVGRCVFVRLYNFGRCWARTQTRAEIRQTDTEMRSDDSRWKPHALALLAKRICTKCCNNRFDFCVCVLVGGQHSRHRAIVSLITERWLTDG